MVLAREHKAEEVVPRQLHLQRLLLFIEAATPGVECVFSLENPPETFEDHPPLAFFEFLSHVIKP